MPVYWVSAVSKGERLGAVSRLVKGEGTPQQLATARSAAHIALDSRFVYYGAEHVRILRVPKQGGTAEVVVRSSRDLGPARALAVDDRFLYWTVGGKSAQLTNVLRLEKPP